MITTAALAELVGGRLVGAADVAIGGISALDDATDADVSLVAKAVYLDRWRGSDAAAALVDASLEKRLDGETRPLIYVPSVELASAAVLTHFAPPAAVPEVGVHPTAAVHDDATIGAASRIGPHVSIDAGATLGNGVTLHAGVRIGAGVTVGDGSTLYPNVVIAERCTIGRGVILHAGVSIGADGFGYVPDPEGRGLVKLPHIGTVELDDGVEIGANSCVDRGKFGATRIGAGTKIDNLVQIGHNCRLGRCCIIVAGCSIGGSCQWGDGVTMAGHAAMKDGIQVGSGATIGGCSAIVEDIAPGESWWGFPAAKGYRALRQHQAVRKLPDLMSRLSATPTAAPSR